MKPFDVLSRDEKISRHLVLEASAGTGKTFSIENIVIRRLIEEPVLPLESLLLVTFTRAAARDLKVRVREALDRSIRFVQDYLIDDCIEGPDYLQALLEQGKMSGLQTLRRLEQAAMEFDLAQIFTIHGFCARALKNYVVEGDVSLDKSELDEGVSIEVFVKIVRDFFRTELTEDLISTNQLKCLINDYKGSSVDLEERLSKR